MSAGELVGYFVDELRPGVMSCESGLTWWVKDDGGPRKATRGFGVIEDVSAILSRRRLDVCSPSYSLTPRYARR